MAILTIPELRELKTVLAQVFTFLRTLKETNPMGRYVKAIQIPPAFSESLTVHLLSRGLILPHLQSASLSRSDLADVVATQNEKITKIEVKATGSKKFQRLSDKDVAADYLVWIHFNFFFQSDEVKPISVFVVEKPQRFLKKGEISLTEFITKTGSELVEHPILFDDLKL